MADPVRDEPPQRSTVLRLPVRGQISRSGTTHWADGTTWPEDYIGRLASPASRMAVFEEMRFSDDAIEIPLNARQQLILSASWMLASADETPKGVEINQFIEDNIYPVLDTILGQLADALQYGFGMCEPVYERLDAPPARSISRGKVRRAAVSKGRKIYLAKIARIRQRTIHTFRISETGDLERIDQWVQANGSVWRHIEIPAQRVLLWVYRQRGDDYWGVPPLRSLYKAWDYKKQLEQILVLGLDKFGIGTPVAVAGDGWSDAEYAKTFEFFAEWRVGEHTGLVVPPGGEVALHGGQGTVHDAILDAIRMYGVQMAKVLLTQSTELGTTETGSRALGESFVEQTEGASQSDCEQIAAIINEKLIVPLVEMNYGPQEHYPLFTPKQRVRQSATFATVVKTLKDAGMKLTAKDEAFLRDTYEMPEIDVEERQAEMDEDAALAKETASALAEGAAAAAKAPPGKKPAAELSRSGAERTEGRAGAGGEDGRPGGREEHPTRALAASPTPNSGPTSSSPVRYRTVEFTEFEDRIIRPQVVGRDLDLQEARLTAEVQDVLRAIDADLIAQAERLISGGAIALGEGVRSLAVPEKLKTKLRTVLLDAARRARDYGANTVHTEIARQDQPAGVGPQRRPVAGFLARIAGAVRELAATQVSAAQLRDISLAAEVDRAVEDEVDRREQSARNAVLDALRAAGSLAVAKLLQVAATAMQRALESLQMSVTQQNVASVVNAGFGIGRVEAVEEYPRVVRSSAGVPVVIPPGQPTPVRPEPWQAPEPIVTPARPTPIPTPPTWTPGPAAPSAPGTPAPTWAPEPATPGAPASPAPQWAPPPAPAPASPPPTKQWAPTIVAKIYSCVLDGNSCEECVRWDGAEFPVDYPEDVTGVQAPNPRCAGSRKRCRCIWVYRTSEEATPIVGPTRGPV